ncbi:MAG: helix-hairpin-helix domain-containing protein [Bacteroidales bacterium]|jgi:hypothetical protein|nr:helix-hairpin-helix domain-containing protein [Bacteroidales bacterium]
MKKLCILFLFSLPLVCIYGQTDSISAAREDIFISDELESHIEEMAEQAEEASDYTELVEDFSYFLQHKININQPDFEQLMNVFGLTDYQIFHLQKYLRTYGQMYSIYELKMIEGMDMKTISKLLNYVEIRPPEDRQTWKLKNAFRYGRHKILMRYGQTLEQQQGYEEVSEADLEKNRNARYLGNPQAYLLKYNFNYRNILRFGFTAEKDAGEEFFKRNNKYGFDFYSFHLFVRQTAVFKAIAIGDYQLSFGQGLAMNMGFSSTKPDNSINIYRNPFGLKPYTSANENNYLRGIAAKIDCKIIDLTIFYSYKKLDARLSDTSSSSEELFIETLQTTGYHRTASEMEKKNAIGQHLGGLHADYNMRVARIGVTALYTHFDTPLKRDLSFYNAYTFNEQNNLNVAIDYRALVKKVGFFGELAMSKNLGFASLNGMIFHIDPRFSLSVLHRYYSRDYQALNGGAFGESAANANEHGLFVGYQFILSKYFTLNMHLDYFRFEWLRYRVDAPSDGYEAQTKVEFRLNRRFSAYFRLKYKQKAINYAANYYNEITHYHRQSYRLHWVYNPFFQLTLKSRIEILNYQAAKHADFRQGYIMYQDIKWSLKKIPLNVSLRFAVFDAYSYNERIYTYEDDVLYAFSVPAFYGKGTRVYLSGKISITSYLDLWAKIAQTFYRDKTSIGNSLTFIDGNTRTDVKMQVMIKL